VNATQRPSCFEACADEHAHTGQRPDTCRCPYRPSALGPAPALTASQRAAFTTETARLHALPEMVALRALVAARRAAR
jgi:hypothetical protein